MWSPGRVLEWTQESICPASSWPSHSHCFRKVCLLLWRQKFGLHKLWVPGDLELCDPMWWTPCCLLRYDRNESEVRLHHIQWCWGFSNRSHLLLSHFLNIIQHHPKYKILPQQGSYGRRPTATQHPCPTQHQGDQPEGSEPKRGEEGTRTRWRTTPRIVCF